MLCKIQEESATPHASGKMDEKSSTFFVGAATSRGFETVKVADLCNIFSFFIEKAFIWCYTVDI